jgi:hypothetical protein
MKKNSEMTLDPALAQEAQSLVALAFRNGPIEDVHAGKECPACSGKMEYSHITQAEMKKIMKRAVDKLYALLWIRMYCPDVYEHVVRAGSHYTQTWNLPEHARAEIESMTRFAELLGNSKPSKFGARQRKTKTRRNSP